VSAALFLEVRRVKREAGDIALGAIKPALPPQR
jgi:hypothetical protein